MRRRWGEARGEERGLMIGLQIAKKKNVLVGLSMCMGSRISPLVVFASLSIALDLAL
jgi:hypothetical protein